LALRTGDRPIRMPTDKRQHHEKSDDISDSNGPTVTKPRSYGLAFGVHVGQGDAGGRAEPDHRSAEAHGISEIAPIVAALLQGERGQRNIVEDSRQKTEPERGLPAGR